MCRQTCSSRPARGCRACHLSAVPGGGDSGGDPGGDPDPAPAPAPQCRPATWTAPSWPRPGCMHSWARPCCPSSTVPCSCAGFQSCGKRGRESRQRPAPSWSNRPSRERPSSAQHRRGDNSRLRARRSAANRRRGAALAASPACVSGRELKIAAREQRLCDLRLSAPGGRPVEGRSAQMGVTVVKRQRQRNNVGSFGVERSPASPASLTVAARCVSARERVVRTTTGSRLGCGSNTPQAG